MSTTIDNGLSLPAVGASLDLTDEMNGLGLADLSFNTASIGQTAANEWLYQIDMEYDRGTRIDNIVLRMEHISTGSANDYSGVLSYRVNGSSGDFPGGNCPDSERTLNGSLRYQRGSLTDIAFQSRSATFCGAGVDGLTSGAGDDTDNMVDPARYYLPVLRPDGWSENFNLFVGNFNPVDLSGRYAYVWQAGAGDSHSRVFNIEINSESDPLDGEAYAGFGDRVAATDGGINGMICNWAGPGSDHTLQPYAQRQFVEQDPATLIFDARVGMGSADITYAPTNNCEYDGSGSFVYDQDLDNDLSDETPTAVSADLMAASDTDGDGLATVRERIADRGYTLPSAPGNWPDGS